MGFPVLVVGRSGSGKSASLHGFSPGEVGVFECVGKPLPFRRDLGAVSLTHDGRGREMTPAQQYEVIVRALARNTKRAYVVDDATYLPQLELMARAREGGYEKYVDIAQHFTSLLTAATHTDDDTITYILCHPAYDDSGRERINLPGRMVQEKVIPEGMVPVCVDCDVRDGEHVFVTENDGYNLAKAPYDFESGAHALPPTMPNDLKAVDTMLRRFWGMRPTTDDAKASDE